MWVFKGAAWGLTHILPWECGLLMALMPNQFKDMICFDLLYLSDMERLIMGLGLQVRLDSA